MTSILRRNASQPASVRPMVGDTKTSMVREDHIGWLKCDGRALSVAEYRGLFNVLGYEFGGSGAYFNLPNSQGRVMGLIGQSVGEIWIDGDISGEETHTLIIAELPEHNHDICGGALNTDNGVDPSGNGKTSAELTNITIQLAGLHNHGGQTGATGSAPESETVQIGGGAIVAGSGTHTHTIASDGAHTHAITDPKHYHSIASNGSSLPHNTMQPTLFLGNLFIYSGLLTKNIAGPDGVSIPAVNRSHYPPAAPAIRLY